MKRWTTHSITTSTTAEVLEDGLETTADIERKIVAVVPEATAAFPCVIYVDQDKVVEYNSNMRSAASPPVEVDIPLPRGASVKIGWGVCASAAAKVINVCYEET